MPKVLIADDSPLIRRMLSTLFASSVGCEVLEAGDGQRALDLARAEHPRVAVLDLDMPKLNGFEVCTALKADDATRDIPVLILTGTGGDDVQAYAFAAGADGFYEKPLGTRALCQRVEELLTAHP